MTYNGLGRVAGVAELVYAAASKAAGPQGPCGFESHPRHHPRTSPRPLSGDLKLRAYVIGVALGDGNLTNPNGRATRLRITCDPKCPQLIVKFRRALQALFPENRVGIIRRPDGCVDVSCVSNHREGLLGWKAGNGSKIRQGARVPDWILSNRAFSIECLRGLIETDGTVYVDGGYPMVMFTTASLGLAEDFAGPPLRTHGWLQDNTSRFSQRLTKTVSRVCRTMPASLRDSSPMASLVRWHTVQSRDLHAGGPGVNEDGPHHVRRGGIHRGRASSRGR